MSLADGHAMLPATDLFNKPVITRDGRILGKVASLRIDAQWKVPLLTLSLNRDVAEQVEVRKPLFGSPKVFLDPERVSALGDNAILDRSLEEIPDVFATTGTGVEAQKVLGRKVLGEEDTLFGSVENLVVDSGKWRITDVVVDVHRKAADAMGFPLTIFGTCHAKVPVKRVGEVSDRLRVAVGPDRFKEYVVKERSRA